MRHSLASPPLLGAGARTRVTGPLAPAIRLFSGRLFPGLVSATSSARRPHRWPRAWRRRGDAVHLYISDARLQLLSRPPASSATSRCLTARCCSSVTWQAGTSACSTSVAGRASSLGSTTSGQCRGRASGDGSAPAMAKRWPTNGSTRGREGQPEVADFPSYPPQTGDPRRFAA